MSKDNEKGGTKMDCPICKGKREPRKDIKDEEECLYYFFSEFWPKLGLSPHGCNLMQKLKCGHEVPKHEHQTCVGWARCGEDWKRKTSLGQWGKIFRGETL
ncbi:MAG: hypothetical protein COV69_03420 [Parcubacteria group bacterium CG11_big_fil_rev_8_21_14_0_20_39_14]|nr:MAG: hypothetical protein COV69_03420 [Parcubacteria group bacterium CG11_big_fil_rev_8_21_14_0_20_39_14]PIS35808.1 MAG: hypothetical protein COT36_00465 [Parcubacteria group bacterium CG08_land_8_20_14_0_20_38_56]